MQTVSLPKKHNPRLHAYYTLCKPRVVALMLLTAWVGMLLAPESTHTLGKMTAALIGIALTSAAGAALNHLIDRHYDALMKRTERRPLVSGELSPHQAVVFAVGLGISGMVLLIAFVNGLTALLTLGSLVGYAIIYTIFLKHATPQNIVLGGLAGAMPPLLGWVAMTGQVDPQALLLAMIIFTWTPPHFWALAIYRKDDYAKARIPMLPITHGLRFTKLCILLYTLLLTGASLLPFSLGMSGWFYLAFAVLLDIGYLAYVLRLFFSDHPRHAFKGFQYSIFYLGVLFVAMLIDHYSHLT